MSMLALIAHYECISRCLQLKILEINWNFEIPHEINFMDTYRNLNGLSK